MGDVGVPNEDEWWASNSSSVEIVNEQRAILPGGNLTYTRTYRAAEASRLSDTGAVVNYSLLHTLIPARFSPPSSAPLCLLLLSHFEDDTIGTGSAERNVSGLLILEFENERGTFLKNCV